MIISRADLGAAITAARVRAGLSQEQLGELTGLGQAAVSRIESGHRKVESIELLMITRALRVDLAELLAAAAAGGTDPAEDLQLLEPRLHDCDPGAVKALGWVRTFLQRLEHLEELNRA